jgi:hypothetical protein
MFWIYVCVCVCMYVYVCVCSLAIIIVHANRFFSAPLCTVICGVSGYTVVCRAIPCFSTRPHKRHDFRETVMKYNSFTFSTFAWNVPHFKNSVTY